MTDIRQISVFLENRSGTLSEITRLLAESGVNLRALSLADSADYGVLRLIADNAEKATEILNRNGFIVSLTPVTVISVPDEPSGLSGVLEILAEGGVDIEYIYSLFTHQNGKAYMVFRIADETKFMELITAHQMKIANKDDLGLC